MCIRGNGVWGGGWVMDVLQDHCGPLLCQEGILGSLRYMSAGMDFTP